MVELGEDGRGFLKGEEMHKRNGFTLIELLVVIGLIGVLMALLLPAIIKAKNTGKEKRVASNAKVITSSINAYKLRYHKWPAKKSDLVAGEDVTYGTDGRDNHLVIDKLIRPPDGGGASSDEAVIDLSDFIVDKSGNILKEPGGPQYRIRLDIDGDYSPSGGVDVN